MQRRPGDPIANLAIGRIIEVDGTHVVAELGNDIAELTRVYNGSIYPIGQFGSILKVHFNRRLIYAYVSRLRMKADFEREQGIPADQNSSARVIEADLFGEGEWTLAGGEWTLGFERGVSCFPLPQQVVYLTPREELLQIFGKGSEASVCIGEHVGTGGASCYVDADELLGKHAAILGSTGSGKSSAAAAVLHALLGKKGTGAWHPRVVLLDPHNEYGNAFPNHMRLSTDEGSLNLPYWMLDLEESVSLMIGRTEFAATSQTDILKNAILAARRENASCANLNPEDVTVDSPIPYALGDPSQVIDALGNDSSGNRYDQGLVGHINAQRPLNKDKKDHEGFSKLIRKLQSLCSDARLSFMMKSWHPKDGDSLPTILAQIIGDGPPIIAVDLSGLPNEIAGAASSALARMVFSSKLWQTIDERRRSPLVLVCEEAHRYVPEKGEAQYAAARAAIQRIAKEGRKYGIGLLLVSQRPSEVDATVLSQCNTWIVLRITNETDREKVRSILPDSLVGLTKILSGLRQREAIVVGQATSLPSRILITRLDATQLPQSHDISFVDGWKAEYLNESALGEIATRWRLQDRRGISRGIAASQTEQPPPF